MTVKLEEKAKKWRRKLSCTHRTFARFDIMVCYSPRSAEDSSKAMEALWNLFMKACSRLVINVRLKTFHNQSCIDTSLCCFWSHFTKPQWIMWRKRELCVLRFYPVVILFSFCTHPLLKSPLFQLLRRWILTAISSRL